MDINIISSGISRTWWSRKAYDTTRKELRDIAREKLREYELELFGKLDETLSEIERSILRAEIQYLYKTAEFSREE